MRRNDASPLVANTSDDLIWSPADQMGFYDVDAYLAREGIQQVYGETYFQKYQVMDQQPMAEDLNRFRSLMVLDNLPALESHHGVATVLDVGIGGGGFIKSLIGRTDMAGARMEVRGVDINPFAITWLLERRMMGDLDSHYDVVTFWDSLEHFRDPAVPLQCAGYKAIVSLPIFRDAEHALSSKHYRKDEHFWYFTRAGFIAWADRQGFWVTDVRIHESLIGRQDIETFVLRRKHP